MSAPGMRRSPSPIPDTAQDLEQGRSTLAADDDAHAQAAAALGAQIPRRASPFSSPGKAAYGQEQQGIQLNVSSAKRYGQAVGMRAVRAVRKGQLPLLLLFFCCVLVFFGALTGFGYVDPDTTGLYPTADGALGEFQVGQPVFDRGALDESSRLDEMRLLEEEWARKKRPKDGAWMKKQRDQRAVRRVPLPNSPGSRSG